MGLSRMILQTVLFGCRNDLYGWSAVRRGLSGQAMGRWDRPRNGSDLVDQNAHLTFDRVHSLLRHDQNRGVLRFQMHVAVAAQQGNITVVDHASAPDEDKIAREAQGHVMERIGLQMAGQIALLIDIMDVGVIAIGLAINDLGEVDGLIALDADKMNECCHFKKSMHLKRQMASFIMRGKA